MYRLVVWFFGSFMIQCFPLMCVNMCEQIYSSTVASTCERFFLFSQYISPKFTKDMSKKPSIWANYNDFTTTAP